MSGLLPKLEKKVDGLCDLLDSGQLQGADGAQGPAGPDGADGLDAPISNLTPIPDNEVDTAIRAGQAGTSAQVSRADHNHPIRRQGNPGDPVLTAGGNLTLQQSIITDRWSTEETYKYEFRVLTQQAAGTGWGFVTVPNIAGFQRPVITAAGAGYQFSSVPTQIDTPVGAGGVGATPRGPAMNQELKHWSSTQRLYGPYFRRDNEHRAYTSFTVEYIRS